MIIFCHGGQMKSKRSLLLGSVVLVFTIVSCSSIVESTRKSVAGDESPRKKEDAKIKWVSKTQYDELMEKYKKLNNKYESLKDNSIKGRSGLEEIDHLASESVETIDVFGKESSSEGKGVVPTAISEKKVESDVDYYKKAETLLANGKSEEALKILHFLEKSSVDQLRVRAKRHIGDIYLKKKQYDLALQVFESILQENSYSSLVLVALEKAVLCSEKLGLVDKKSRYDSLLKDAFEMRG